MWLLLDCMHPPSPSPFSRMSQGNCFNNFKELYFHAGAAWIYCETDFSSLKHFSLLLFFGERTVVPKVQLKTIHLICVLSCPWNDPLRSKNYDVGDQEQQTMEALLFEQIIRTPKKANRLNSRQKGWTLFFSTDFLLSILLAFHGDVQRHQNPHLIWSDSPLYFG